MMDKSQDASDVGTPTTEPLEETKSLSPSPPTNLKVNPR